MTVSSTLTKNSYDGDGVTPGFTYGFKIFDDDDITVIIRTIATGTETVKTKGTHYTVSGVGNAGGGTVTFTVGNIPADTEKVFLVRSTALTQATDYTPNDPFPAESHENALDKLTFMAQEIQEELDRSIKVSATNTITSTEFTTDAATRANKVFGFDSAGELAVTQELGTNRGSWAAGVSYQQRDIVKDTSTSNIFMAKTAHTSSGSEPLTTNTDSAKWDLIVDAAAAGASASTASDHREDAGKYATTAHDTPFTLTATNGGASGLYSALHYATESASSASAASTSETNASAFEDTAELWSIKVDGAVAGGNYSSKAWAIGGVGVTDAAGSGAAKEWAVETSSNVDGTEYSAKEYSIGSGQSTGMNTGSSKQWAIGGGNSFNPLTPVTGTGPSNYKYSAQYWAEKAEESKTEFSNLYHGSSSTAPTGSEVGAGDLWFDSGSNSLKYYNTLNQWVAIEATDTTNFATNGFSIAMAIAL